MPVKNASPFLRECLDSILEQTIDDWELITVDDHSSDESVSILKSYADSHPRIKTFPNDGIGIIHALRLAYKISSGNYITRMDADDIMTANKLELLVEQLKYHGTGNLAVGLVKYISTTELGEGYRSYEYWLNELSRDRINFEWIYKECPIPSPAWMLHREDLDKCGAFDADIYPEDYNLAFRMRDAGLSVQPTSKVVHHWRDHPQRSSRTDDNYKDNSFIQLKVYHFLKSDHDISKSLILWGCGKKGKRIANLLIENDINFDWITNNPKKIGHNIYGVIIKADQDIANTKNKQVIIAIAEKDSLSKIIVDIMMVRSSLQKEYFFFC